MGLDFDGAGFLSGMTEAELKMRFAVEKYGESAGKKLEAKAKKDAPWADRTGNARNSIQGGAEWNGDHIDVYVSGNMEYSPCLELANEKKNAVLWPTIQALAPELIQGMHKLLDK